MSRSSRCLKKGRSSQRATGRESSRTDPHSRGAPPTLAACASESNESSQAASGRISASKASCSLDIFAHRGGGETRQDSQI
eukprot:scaffold117722_cov31-Tisochrysis_lutea.AAC.1